MTNFDILEALNNVDDECVKKAKATTTNRTNRTNRFNKNFYLKLGAMTACFCLMLAVMTVYQIQHRSKPIDSDIPSTTDNYRGSQFTVEQGIIVDGKLYIPDTDLSKTATKENIGSIVGYISFDNKTILDISAFEYVPNDGKTNKVIVTVSDLFYVYSFYSYMPGENESRITDLLSKAVSVKIRDENYAITDPNAFNVFIEVLSLLDDPHTQKELNRYYFDKFKDRFGKGEIWIDENGSIAHGGNPFVSNKLYSLINGEDRIILVIMEDNTYLTYYYLEGAGVIRLEDFGYGFILTEEQIEKIDQLLFQS